MNIKSSTTSRTITPQLAAKWLESKVYQYQRPLREGTVHLFVEYIKNGEFRENSVITLAGPNGDDFIVDGQHRLWAIFESGTDVTLLVSRIECSEKDLGKLYSEFDVAGNKRTTMDIVIARHDPRAKDLFPQDQNYLESATRIIRAGFISPNNKRSGTKQETMNERFDMAIGWVKEMQLLKSDLNGCPEVMRSKFRRKNVMALALYTYRHCSDKAREFWPLVATADGLPKNDPRRALYDFMIQTSMKQYQPNKNKISLEVSLRIVAKAWNYFYQGKFIDRLYLKKSEIYEPVYLLGTPLADEQEAG